MPRLELRAWAEFQSPVAGANRRYRRGVSFYDALIVQAAIASGCARLLSAEAVSAISPSMATKAQDDRILKRSRAALDEMHGRRLERVVLFGSRARGDAAAGFRS